jgi:tetratricopeptide (TPR) repeat protein
MTRTWPLAAFATTLTLAATGNRSAPQSTPALPRSCIVALTADAGPDRDITKLQQDLREGRASARAAEQLGYRFISRARLSNDAGFYKVAEQAAACLESYQPDDPSAWLLRGHILHQLHRFGEAEAIARRLIDTREFVLDFGLLGDALMEQGRLAEAAAAYQKMVDLKPFYQSYTRAAHLRWLKGDLNGAVRLMTSAVKAASPRDPESIAWGYARLAAYELQRGRLDSAEQMAVASMQSVPDYASALLVKGRIRLAQKEYPEAIELLEHAARLNPLPDYQWVLGDALRAAGRPNEAAAAEQLLLQNGAADDPRTLALYLSTRLARIASAPEGAYDMRAGDGQRAVDLARHEIRVRSDVFTLDALAWALVNVGEVHEASALIERALAEGTADARLFLHASVIAAADGRSDDAARWATKARQFRFTLLPSELGVLQGIAVVPPRA